MVKRCDSSMGHGTPSQIAQRAPVHGCIFCVLLEINFHLYSFIPEYLNEFCKALTQIKMIRFVPTDDECEYELPDSVHSGEAD